ncbi:MAG: methyl-accepting chemotaxis protein [Candidatus Pelagadaptatus aseana]|uniref:HAMP domain-containing methyl-accepting chemotaxis protein n=1 Tax=Candidatus Pelagadaptatus aseana TaxID=3120508 RepID=UPI0039B19F48
MRITITTKIIAGYVLAILLSLGIMFVGLMGINRINDGLQNIVNGSMPMIGAVSEANGSMLTADLKVMQFVRLPSLEGAEEIESDFKQQSAISTEQTKIIQGIAQNHPKLNDAAQPIEGQFKQFYEVAQSTIDSHRATLEAKKVFEQQQEAVLDISDTLIDLTYDLQELPLIESDSNMIGLVIRAQNSIDIFLEAIGDAASERTLDATETARNMIINEMETIEIRVFNGLGIPGVFDNDIFIQFKEMAQGEFMDAITGDQGALKLLENEIQLRIATDQLKTDMDAVSGDLRSTLGEFSALVNKISDEEVKAEAEAAVSTNTTLLTVFSVIAVVVLSAIAYLITLSIRAPLKHIVDNITKVATGDLRQTFKVESNDELGDLSQAMQELVDTLRSMIEKINTNSDQLAQTADSTAGIARSSYDNINSQTEQTSRVAVSVQEMSATVAEVAQSVSNTLQQVESTHNDVNSGEQLLQSNIHDINELAGNIEHGSTVIERLNENTNNIGSILDVIRGIAEQTNLLALNAAIEAARAGEQGRGFAVVADEVRTLASRTQDSTSEIQEMIGRLQQGAKEAVDTMSQSRTDAQQSAEKIAEAGRMLSDIARSVDVIKDMSTQIASATEEQSQTAREQSEMVSNISSLASSTAEGAQESLDASQEMAGMAETQSQLLSQFKV